MNERKVVRYSEAFKLQVVRELEDGTFRTVEEARQRYGIAGSMTVQRWLRRLGRDDLNAKVVRVEKPGERDQFKAMQRKIRDLEHALAETRMRELISEGHYKALCDQIGVEPEEQKKKLRGTRSIPRAESDSARGE